MQQQGVLIDKDGAEYSIFIINTKGFYRMDICQGGANFHVEPDKVLYSKVSKKTEFMFGNPELYDLYTKVKSAPEVISLSVEKDSYWEGGKFYSKSIQAKADKTYLYELIECNGKQDSFTIFYDGCYLMLATITDYGEGKLDPLNFADYTEVTLSGIVNTTTTAPYYPISVLRATYDIKHLDDMDFEVADTLELARQRLREYDLSAEPLRGFDTETSGVDVDLYGEDQLVGVVLSYSETNSTYYPFRMEEVSNLPMEFLDELMEVVIRHQDDTVAQYGQFDRKVMMKEGYDLRVGWDTNKLSFMCNSVIEKGLHALKPMMLRLNGKKYLELDEIFVSSNLIKFQVLPKDIVRLYACPDASNVIALHKALYAKLPEYTRNIYKVECELAHIKADQEYWGMRVDVPAYKLGRDNCDYCINTLVTKLREVTGIDGNLRSAIVLTNLMYNQLQCPIIRRTKTGAPSTGAAVIKKLSSKKVEDKAWSILDEDIEDLYGKPLIKANEINNAKYPALLLLAKYKVYMKLKTAFYARFDRTVKSGRIFFWVNGNGAASGRQSSPMHQLPEEMKAMIIPDYDDCNMLDPDYSQIELRMVGFLAGEKDLIELCKDPEKDIHRVIGSLITGKPMWSISAAERKRDKSRNFGVVYLISEFGLADQMFGAGAREDTALVAKARQSLDEFYARFKRIRKYIADNRKKVQETGEVTTFFGRVRPFPQIFDPDLSSMARASLIRQANNTPVQGTAADILKIAEVNLDTYIRSKGWNRISPEGFPYVRDALSIHDEVIIMAHPSVPLEELFLMIRTCMELPVEGAAPFFCSPALVPNWAGHSESALECPVLLRDKLIAAYQSSGVSKIDANNYKETMIAYRNGKLEAYMKALIKEYGTDYKVVCEHVRHPTLTHSLIEQYDETSRMPDHLQAIELATKLYIEGAIQDGNPEKDIADLSYLEDAEPLVETSADGEISYVVEEEEVEDYSVTLDENEAKSIMTFTQEGLQYVWELGDCLCVDVSELLTEQANLVLRELHKYKDDEGFFPVVLYVNSRLLETGFRVEELPMNEINSMIGGFITKKGI